MRLSIPIPRWSATPLCLALVACGGDGLAEPAEPPPEPAALVAVSGDEQAGKAGERLPEALVVRVIDARGEGVGGVAVSWRVTSGAGDVAAVTTTGPTGTSRAFFRPTALGTSRVTAEVAGLRGSPATFSADVGVVVIRFMYDFMFGPYPHFASPEGSNGVAVPVGTAVEWVWEGEDVPGIPETVRIVSTTVPPGGEPFDSGPLRPGERFRFVPHVAGSWEFEERLHAVKASGSLMAR